MSAACWECEKKQKRLDALLDELSRGVRPHDSVLTKDQTQRLTLDAEKLVATADSIRDAADHLRKTAIEIKSAVKRGTPACAPCSAMVCTNPNHPGYAR